MKITQVRQNNYGVYLWQLPNGKFLADSDLRFLSISAQYGDIQAMARLQRTAATYGFPEGKAVWEDGHKISDQEWEDERADFYTNGIIRPEAR